MRALRRLVWHFRRGFGRTDRRLARSYLSGAGPHKLHIGCGGHWLQGWLNADLYPRSADVLHLDATQPFPLSDETFDYVFSEHMIEHVPLAAGCNMLAECHRVLRLGGKIRISTPDLAFLIDLYRPDRSPLEERYLRWASETFLKNPLDAAPAYVINNFVRDWGHQFIYDEDSLHRALAAAGFGKIVRCRLQESPDRELTHLENENRMPSGLLALETLTLEGTKE